MFLRGDFSDMGGYDQVGRALRGLVREGQLMKVGYGIYANTRLSVLDGKPTLTKGIRELAAEALGRLGIETVPTRMERAYNDGRITQVPTGRVIGVRGRVRRQICYNGVPLSYERARPDRLDQRTNVNERAAKPPAPITVREALRLMWEAEHYPVRGNEDWREAAAFGKKARAQAATAKTSPDDPPEFGPWLAALCCGQLAPDERDRIMDELYALFAPVGDTP